MADARRMGKSELFSHFAERFEVKRTQAREFFDELLAPSLDDLCDAIEDLPTVVGAAVCPGSLRVASDRPTCAAGRRPSAAW